MKCGVVWLGGDERGGEWVIVSRKFKHQKQF